MRYRVILRVFTGLVYLGILGVVVGAVLGRITAFEGRVVVALRRTESLALRPNAGGMSLALTRNMPLDVLPLDNPRAVRTLLDGKKAYDAAPLGLRLRLDEVSVLAPASERDVIEVTPAKGGTIISDARPGVALPLETGACTVSAVEPWAGLVRDPSGRRMAAFSFQRGESGDWVQGLFAEAGQWTILPPEMALRLDWVDSEDAARTGLPGTRPGLDAARWSVANKGRVHWFDTFTPGTGETLADGTEYVLLAVNTNPGKLPSITVGIRKAGAARRVEVPANAAEALDGLRFEYPGAMPLLVIARAWRDGAAWLVSFGQGGNVGPVRMDEGGEWDAMPGLRFRMDQTMQQGLPVGLRGAPVWMAAVSTGTGELLRLREGLAVRQGGASFRYRRLPQPPQVRYAFQALSLSGKPFESFSLGPGEKHRVREWLLTQSDDNLNADQSAVLIARRLPLSRYGVIGLLLIGAGGVGWVLTQLRLRPRNAEPPWTDLKPAHDPPPDAPET
jgi:hypothetical protein